MAHVADDRDHELADDDVERPAVKLRRGILSEVGHLEQEPASRGIGRRGVVLRGVTFVAALHMPANDADALALLAACVKAVRRGGLGRNRGRGKLALALQQNGSDVTAQHFDAFAKLVAANAAVRGGK